MSQPYEYMDEINIDPELICPICLLPFDDPYYTPCNDTFCLKCITHWIEVGKDNCPHCRRAISIKTLNKIPRPLQNILDELRVKCTICGQTELQRGNFGDHIQKLCPKMIISCSSADIKCPWTGQRDELNQHLLDCRFELMRPVIAPLIRENEQLKDQIDRQMTEITLRDSSIEKFLTVQEQLMSQIKQQEREKRQLKNRTDEQQNVITRLMTPLETYQHQTNVQTSQKNTQSKPMGSDSEKQKIPPLDQLDCGGYACPKCRKCRDWYSPGYFSSYKKHDGATCRLAVSRSHLCLCADNNK